MHNHPEDNTFCAFRKNGPQNKDIEQKSLIFALQNTTTLQLTDSFDQKAKQGIRLTEREGSVQLTPSLRLLVFIISK
jgi:hypothetical protein